MIKDIVVNLPTTNPQRIVDYAISVATAFQAHLGGVAFQYEPIIPAADFGSIPIGLIESQRAENKQQAMHAKAVFDEAARRATLSYESRIIESSGEGAAETFGGIARCFDLAMVAQAEPGTDGLANLQIEGALFGSGRPLLVVPYIQTSPLALDRVMVCWDGSRNAARAAADAMPFLALAKSVQVVTVTGEKGKSTELPGVDIAAHLARHGLKVALDHVAVGEVDIANNLLSIAADNSADLMVMGGYGHTRLREFILGGATRGILDSMTVPTLMSH